MKNIILYIRGKQYKSTGAELVDALKKSKEYNPIVIDIDKKKEEYEKN